MVFVGNVNAKQTKDVKKRFIKVILKYIEDNI